ncbi:hypothetical protein EJB05_13466, partial [Eragrostis curvula]
MMLGSGLFLAGSIINVCAVNISMLIIGRMLLGLSAPLCLSETAPAKWRGAFASAYTAFSVTGHLFATVTNISLTDPWLGLARLPRPGGHPKRRAFFVSDTPSSLVLRGHPDKARAALRRFRGPDADVDGELKDIIRAVDEANRNEDGAFRRLFSKEYRHCMVIGVAIPVFYELTGISAISIFLPVLFRTVGFGSQKAILGSVINSTVSLVATLLASSVMDLTGRRILYIVGGDHFMDNGCSSRDPRGRGGDAAELCDRRAGSYLAMHFLLGRVVGTAEVGGAGRDLPVEVRSAGQAMSMSIWLCLLFLELQVFIKMLCVMKYGLFLFHTGFLLVGTIFLALFLPETKGVPLELMRSVWMKHWYWRKFIKDDKQDNQDN